MNALGISCSVDALKRVNDGKNEQLWYDYTYGGNLSVTEVKDVETGAVSYVTVFTVTRTAAQQNK